MVGITPSGLKILRYVWLNGPSTAYDMSKKLGEPPPVVSDKTAYTLLPRLVESGFLTVVTKKIKTRLKKEYSLTVLGFSLALDRTKPEEYRPIIERWADLVPFVTGKWNLFINGGVEDRALKMLELAASFVCNDVFHEPMNLGHSKDFVEIFSQNFYNPHFIFSSPEEDLSWVKACAQDQEVREYFTDKLTMIIEKEKMMLNYAENLKAQMMAQTLKDKKGRSSTTA